jgi:hypothetical protein
MIQFPGRHDWFQGRWFDCFCCVICRNAFFYILTGVVCHVMTQCIQVIGLRQALVGIGIVLIVCMFPIHMLSSTLGASSTSRGRRGSPLRVKTTLGWRDRCSCNLEPLWWSCNSVWQLRFAAPLSWVGVICAPVSNILLCLIWLRSVVRSNSDVVEEWLGCV